MRTILFGSIVTLICPPAIVQAQDPQSIDVLYNGAGAWDRFEDISNYYTSNGGLTIHFYGTKTSGDTPVEGWWDIDASEAGWVINW